MKNTCFETRPLLFIIDIYTTRLHLLLSSGSVDVGVWISIWLNNQSIIQCTIYFVRLSAQNVYCKLKFMDGKVSRLYQLYVSNLSLIKI
jgi:hypothetical protein